MSNEERRVRMRRAMASQQLDALVLRLPENVLLLSGHWPMIGAAFLVFPLEGKATCILPACYKQEALGNFDDCEFVFFPFGGKSDPPMLGSLKKLIGEKASSSWKRIGYEGDFETVAPSWNAGESMVPAATTSALLSEIFPGKELLDVSGLIINERVRKTSHEVERLGLVGEISAIGLAAFEEAVKVGVSGVELVAIVEKAIMVKGTGHKGAVRVRAFAQVSTGNAETAEGHRPNIISTPRPMADGDFAMLELGVVADGYWADRTRVRVAGTPRDKQIEVFETVRKAQEAATNALKPGVKARDVDAAARSVIEEAGYGKDFPHITGHGLGFGYHESWPILGPSSDHVMEEGMLTSVEPGIYNPAFGGVRIEDDVVVTNNGPLVLGPFRKTLN